MTRVGGYASRISERAWEVVVKFFNHFRWLTEIEGLIVEVDVLAVRDVDPEPVF